MRGGCEQSVKYLQRLLKRLWYLLWYKLKSTVIRRCQSFPCLPLKFLEFTICQCSSIWIKKSIKTSTAFKNWLIGIWISLSGSSLSIRINWVKAYLGWSKKLPSWNESVQGVCSRSLFEESVLGKLEKIFLSSNLIFLARNPLKSI